MRRQAIWGVNRMYRKYLLGIMAGMLAVFLIHFMAVGVAEDERTDADWQWKYVLEGGGATVTGYVLIPGGAWVIPGKIDGYPTIGIGDRAFERLIGLTSINIPNTVNTIGDFAFYDCRLLSEMTIPASVIRIGLNPFTGCHLNTIRVDPSNPVYADVKGVLFDNEQKLLVSYPGARKGKYTIPKGTLRIGESVFEWSSVTGCSIPGSVTVIGENAFYMCSKLAAVTISKGVGQISDKAFANCRSLKKVTIPGSCSSIGDLAFFGCESLKTVTIEKGVERIGNAAFSDCDGLTKVTIPDSVSSIGFSVFSGCGNLKSITIPNSVMSMGDSTFSACTSLIKVSIPDGVTKIGKTMFRECYSLASVVIPDSVTSIGVKAFYYCRSLTSLTIPASVTDIEKDAFGGCYATLTVTKGSYAEQYAKENNIPYVFTAE